MREKLEKIRKQEQEIIKQIEEQDTMNVDMNSSLNKLLQEYKITQERLEKEKLLHERLVEHRSYIKRFVKLYTVREMGIHRFFRVGWLAPPPLPPREQEFEKIIKLANELTENNGAKFYFVYLPQIIRYLDFSQKNTKEFRKYGKIVLIVHTTKA